MLNTYLSPIFQGFVLNMGLIVAIGAQNTFVLRQGLRRKYVTLVVFLSIVFNTLLAVAGVYGLGFLISNSPLIRDIASWLGAMFLFIYGLMAFKSAIKPKAMRDVCEAPQLTALSKIVASAFAFSWFNPHAVFDTVVLVGSVGGRLSSAEKPYFVFGVFLAELAWFEALAFGARLLSPLFAKPSVWRWLDIFVGCIMWYVAALLMLAYFK